MLEIKIANYILIHGAWHGAWCWNKVKDLLESNGHKVICPDLYDIDIPLEKIQLQDYVNYIENIINLQESEPIIVGHSMAGIILSCLGSNSLNKIKSLVYLTAFILNEGESILDISNRYYNPNVELEFSDDAKLCTIKKEQAEYLFYNKCNKKDIEYATTLLKPQPYKIFETKLSLNKGNFNKLPKYYIKCTDDNIVPLAAQKYMIKSQNLNEIFSIDTDHSPFLSSTINLFRILNKISNH
ncbi:MAG: alpha/beta fold hydrolase [Alphaproteobacteria bacterium]